MNNFYNPYTNMNGQYQMQRLQNMRDEIDRQIQNYQQPMQQQPPQNITQNFSLAPNPSNVELEAKYVDNIEEVKNTFVMKTGIFITKDFSKIWIKDVTGNIRIFNTQEEIKIDEKDRALQEKDGMILSLQAEINQLKEAMSNANTAELYNAKPNEPIANDKSAGLSKGTKHPTK